MALYQSSSKELTSVSLLDKNCSLSPIKSMLKKSTVLVSGIFNILHPGHMRLLRFAKDCGNKLIVVVESDQIAGSAAHVPENLRLEGIQSNNLVNEAFIFNEPIENLIERLRPDIVVKGKEHELRLNPELKALESYGGRLIFSSGETIFSSIDLIKKDFKEIDSHSISLPEKYLKQHNIDKSTLIKRLHKFSELKICVIGDLIIDEYITCQALGMSQEDPTIVVTPMDFQKFIGGAGIVAAHASSLGASVNFFSVTGNDETRNYAINSLTNMRVNAQLLIDENRPTTLKQRYRSKNKSLLRVSHLHQGTISLSLQNQMLELIKQNINETNLLVFSDFNYGCLPQTLVDKIISVTKSHDLFLAADSQSSSQVGDISRFKNMDLLTPTEREARISTRNHEDGLVILAELLRQEASAKNILLKLGEEGLLVHTKNKQDHEWATDRISNLNSVAKDEAGAGDSLLITSAMAMACGADIWEAACLGSIAAALQVARVGNTPLRIEEFLQVIN